MAHQRLKQHFINISSWSSACVCVCPCRHTWNKLSKSYHISMRSWISSYHQIDKALNKTIFSKKDWSNFVRIIKTSIFLSKTYFIWFLYINLYQYILLIYLSFRFSVYIDINKAIIRVYCYVSNYQVVPGFLVWLVPVDASRVVISRFQRATFSDIVVHG